MPDKIKMVYRDEAKHIADALRYMERYGGAGMFARLAREKYNFPTKVVIQSGAGGGGGHTRFPQSYNDYLNIWEPAPRKPVKVLDPGDWL